MVKSVRQRHDVRQVQIMEAVTRLITTRGLESVTIKDIAHEVGLTEGALYRHFVSKQQILSYLIYQVGEFLLDSIRERVEEEQSALVNLESIYRAQIRDIEDNWGLALIVVAGAVVFEDADLRPQVGFVMAQYLDRIKTLLQEGIDDGSLRSGMDTDAASFTFFSSVQSLAGLWAMGETSQLAHMGDQVWDIYKRGIIRVA
jgi:TetR/AcrR family transcriptional regulator